MWAVDTGPAEFAHCVRWGGRLAAHRGVGGVGPTSWVRHAVSGPPSDGGHVGAEGEPTCHGGGGRGGDVGAVGEPTPPAGGTSGVRGSGGDDGGVLSAPSSWTKAVSSPGEEQPLRFFAALVSLGEGTRLLLAAVSRGGNAATAA